MAEMKRFSDRCFHDTPNEVADELADFQRRAAESFGYDPSAGRPATDNSGNLVARRTQQIAREIEESFGLDSQGQRRGGAR